MIHCRPKRLTWKKIREEVEDFRSRYSRIQEVPIEIEELIEFDLGLEIIPKHGLKASADVEAFLSKDMQTIFVDNEAYMNSSYSGRLRFTLAEEIGHLVLHRHIYEEGVKYESEEEFIEAINEIDSEDLDWIERQAREFAGRLIVPVHILIDEIKKLEDKIETFHERYHGEDRIEDLAIEAVSKIICAKFGVSWEVVRRRINNEGLIDIFRK
ncbi:MAG: ImmA/IrrE family metallo-endopeptidase [Cyclobacteriaceae bacterium]